MRRRRTIAAVLTAACLTISACTSSGVNTQTGTPAATTGQEPTPGPSPSETVDAYAMPAVAAYEGFLRAAYEAQRKPVGHGQKWSAGGDFTKYSFDPIRSEYEAYIWGLKEQQVEYRGTPDISHITVKLITRHGAPWPTVTLTDCQTGGHWDEYVIKTGRKVPLAGNGNVPPPYLLTLKVIFFQGHWGLMSDSADKSRTCTA